MQDTQHATPPAMRISLQVLSAHESIPRVRAVHETRRAAKAVRAWIRFLPAAEHAGLDDALRTAAQRLGENRDRTVMAETARRIARASSRKSARRAGHAIAAALQTNERATDATQERAAVDAVLDLVRDGLSAIDTAAPSTVRILDTIRDSYGKARKRLRTGLKADDDERLHGARRWIIRLRYQLSVLDVDRDRQVRRLIERLERLRTLLGRHHDIAVLLANLDSIASPCGARGLKTLRTEGLTTQHLLTRAIRRRSKRVFRRHPDRFVAHVARKQRKRIPS